MGSMHSQFWQPMVMPAHPKGISFGAKAGIQIRASDQDVSKTVLMNELDSGVRRNDDLGGLYPLIYSL